MSAPYGRVLETGVRSPSRAVCCKMSPRTNTKKQRFGAFPPPSIHYRFGGICVHVALRLGITTATHLAVLNTEYLHGNLPNKSPRFEWLQQQQRL